MIALAVSHENLTPESYQWGIDDFARQHSRQRWGDVVVIPQPQFRAGSLRRYSLSGLIAFLGSPALAAEARALRVPVVNLSSDPSGLQFPSVGVDNHAIGALAARYFLARGFRHFAYVMPAGKAQFALERGLGFVQAISCGGNTIQWAGGAPAPLRGKVITQERTGGEEWLRDAPTPLAVFAPQDQQAAQIRLAAERLGFAVPRQVAILGVGNDPLVREIANDLSSIILPRRQTGYEAAATLDQLMNGKQPKERLLRIPPQEIVTRASSDWQAVQDEIVELALSWIDTHALHPIGAGDVARVVPLSRRAFERRFRKATGLTPKEKIQQVRLSRAHSLLRDTAMTIEEVAAQCGFPDRNRFFVAFREATGISPSRFRASFCGAREFS